MAIKKKQKVNTPKLESPFKVYWNRWNYIILGAGLAIMFLGYYLMGQAPWDNPVSLTISPIVLLIAYIIVFPAAIFFRKKKNNMQDA